MRRGKWSDEEVELLETHKGKPVKEIAEMLNRSYFSVRYKMRHLAGLQKRKRLPVIKNELPEDFPMSPREDYYFLYRGDEIIAEGTIPAIAYQLDIKVDSVKFYNTPSYKRRAPEGEERVLVHVGKVREVCGE